MTKDIKRGRGRPKMDDATKKQGVYFRLNPEEIKALDKLSDRMSLTRAGVVRKLIRDANNDD